MNEVRLRRICGGSCSSVADRSEFVRHAGAHESVELTAGRQVRSYSPLPQEASWGESASLNLTQLHGNASLCDLSIIFCACKSEDINNMCQPAAVCSYVSLCPLCLVHLCSNLLPAERRVAASSCKQ